MSETLTATQGGADAEPAATTTEATAPVETGAATETTPEPQQQEEQPKPSRADRRIAALSARLAAREQQIDALQRQLAPTPEPEQITAENAEQIIQRRVAEEVEKRALQGRIDAFHAAGRAAHPDWNDRCQSLLQMGGDAPFSQLLVEMDDGARVAAALADDPEEMERIIGLRTDRARAIALGKFAATLEAKPATPARRVTRAPEPPRQISNGSARTDPDEGAMTAQQLVDYYSRQAQQDRAQRTTRQ